MIKQFFHLHLNFIWILSQKIEKSLDKTRIYLDKISRKINTYNIFIKGHGRAFSLEYLLSPLNLITNYNVTFTLKGLEEATGAWPMYQLFPASPIRPQIFLSGSEVPPIVRIYTFSSPIPEPNMWVQNLNWSVGKHIHN